MAKLILIRHGESVWNKKNVFTGWVDVPLSSNGIEEATKAGDQLSKIKIDVIYTSSQIRSIETAMLIIAKNKSKKTPVIIHENDKMQERTTIYSKQMLKNIIPVYQDWHLNERYYGQLQGKNKKKTVLQYGEEQVHLWRRSYDIAPPGGESLKDTALRTIPFFEKKIIPDLKKDKNILISAHGNSLRSIIMFIENLTKESVLNLEIPTGKPFFYEYKDTRLSKI